MAEERIIIEVDDTQVDAAIAKLMQARSLATQSLGTANISRGLQAVTRQSEDLQFTLRPVTSNMERLVYLIGSTGAEDLPSLNRNARILLGRIPGMRAAIQLFFRFKLQMKSLGPGEIALLLTTLANLVLLMKWIQKRDERARREKEKYEAWIRKERGLTKEGYDKLMKEWEVEFTRRAG